MKFWQPGMIADLLFLVAMLGLAGLLRSVLPVIRRYAIPDAMIAGRLGLILGPSLLGIVPFDQSNLEILVYQMRREFTD